MKKKLMLLILCYIMLFNIIYTANAFDSIILSQENFNQEMTFDKDNTASDPSPYEFLLKKGFTEEYLQNLPDKYINELFEKFKNNYVILDNISYKFYDIENKNNVINPFAIIPEYMLKLKVADFVYYDPNTTLIEKIEINITYDWYCNPGVEERPYNRGIDGISTNWDYRFNYKIGSFTHTDYMTTGQIMYRSNDIETTAYNTTTDLAKTGQCGIGYYVNLAPKKLRPYFSKCTGVTKYSIYPKDDNSIYVYDFNPNHGSATNVGVEYAHDTSSGSVGISFSLWGFSVGMNFDTNRVDNRTLEHKIRYSIGRDKRFITTDKDTYYPAEKINITVNDAPTKNSWIGIYESTINDYQNNSTGMWCYVGSGNHDLPTQQRINSKVYLTANKLDITNYDLIPFQPGNYKIVLFQDGGYTPVSYAYFTVKPAEILAATKSNGDIVITFKGAVNEDAWIGIYPRSQTVYHPDYPSITWFYTHYYITDNWSGERTISLHREQLQKYKAVLFSTERYYPIATCPIDEYFLV